MLAICEECASKYNIDESQMKSDTARFSCRKCGHVIVIEKQDLPSSPAKAEKHTVSQDSIKKTSPKKKGVHMIKRKKVNRKGNRQPRGFPFVSI